MARLAAGVRRRANGTLEKRFTVNGKQFSVYGQTSKEIQEKEIEVRKQIELGLYADNRNITLDSYFKEWEKGKYGRVTENTRRTYSSYYRNQISPMIGKRKVQKIERREILELQRKVSEKLSVGATNMCMRTLKVIFHDAVRDGIIVKNPAADIKALKETSVKATESYHRALSVKEQTIFMKEAKNEFLYEFLAFMLCTGVRCGEAAALTWQDVDYKANMIHVNKTTTISGDGSLIIGKTTKTGAGVRDIPMTATVKGILSSQRTKLGNIIPLGTQTVFVGMHGGLVGNCSANRAITNTLDRLAEKGIHIERFTCHAFRDSFATRFIESGGNPKTLQTILGHSNISMTMDLYTHVMEDTKRKEMDNLNIVL
jgi:integrase